MRDDFQARRNFILQQGLADPEPHSCGLQYSALLFQPRIIGVVLVVAIALQQPPIFFALGAILWFSAALPRLNPFDALYRMVRSSAAALPLAPPPRRFAQALAGAFAVAIGILLVSGMRTGAYVLEGLFLLAVGMLALRGFCLGSFVYHVLRGRAAFAIRTLPWAKGEASPE